MNVVKAELTGDTKDNIDYDIEQAITNKLRLCGNGHINENIRANRFKCKKWQ